MGASANVCEHITYSHRRQPPSCCDGSADVRWPQLEPGAADAASMHTMRNQCGRSPPWAGRCRGQSGRHQPGAPVTDSDERDSQSHFRHRKGGKRPPTPSRQKRPGHHDTGRLRGPRLGSMTRRPSRQPPEPAPPRRRRDSRAPGPSSHRLKRDGPGRGCRGDGRLGWLRGGTPLSSAGRHASVGRRDVRVCLRRRDGPSLLLLKARTCPSRPGQSRPDSHVRPCRRTS